MAQDAGGASSALFAGQAEASVADKTIPRHATRASRRVPGMRRAGNMAGPGLGKVYSRCTTMNSSAIVPCCKCKIEIGSACPSLLTTLMFGESSEKSAGWIRKKLELNGGPSRLQVAALPVAKTSTTNISRQSRR